MMPRQISEHQIYIIRYKQNNTLFFRHYAEKEDLFANEVRQIVHSYMYIMSKNELRSSGEHRRCGFANGACEL